MNILITGAYGQLGQCLREYIEMSNNKQLNIFYTDYDTLDITSYVSVYEYITNNNIDAVINCAAYTNVDMAESDSTKAMLVNSIGPKNIAMACRVKNIFMIHISTDYVFGKQEYNIPCGENMKGEPTGVYGKTKLDGESEIIKTGCKYVIIRTSWLYSEYGHNFVKTIINLLNSKKEIKVIFDQVGTPTNAHDLSFTIIHILDEYLNNVDFDKYGIYHFSNEGVCSWYDFAQMIKKLINNDTCKIIPCHTNEFPSNVKRPNYSVLDKTKIKNTFNIEIPYWYDSLKTCIENIK